MTVCEKFVKINSKQRTVSYREVQIIWQLQLQQRENTVCVEKFCAFHLQDDCVRKCCFAGMKSDNKLTDVVAVVVISVCFHPLIPN